MVSNIIGRNRRALGSFALRCLVVFLTARRSKRGTFQPHNLVRLASKSGDQIRECPGSSSGRPCVDKDGNPVDKNGVIGTALAVNTRHKIHVFFIGIGDDVDFDVGRGLAEATNSCYEGAAEKDVPRVIEKFGKYF